MIKKDTLSPEQEVAAEPTRNVWVQANAGTGKTSVLVARLLRILFRDTKHSGILCLTYTNAAAGEMRNRILSALRGWALASDSELVELLRGITINANPTSDDIMRARKIFFYYIDNPDVLKIKTIHGFCEEILRRFPLEAGISPSWTLISDAPQNILLHQALDMLVNSVADNSRLTAAFDHLVGVVSEYKIDALLGQVEQQYKHFFRINDFDSYRQYFIDNIKQKLNLDADICTDVPYEKLKTLITTAKNDKKAGKKIENLISLTEQYIEKTIDFDRYKTAYLTKDGLPIASGLDREYLTEEKARVFALNSYYVNQKIFTDTVAFFDLAAAFAQQYQALKRTYDVLDFEDLILYTHRLFSNPETMGWVLSQLDLSLSHILVDEAQDTGPLQWELLRMLVGDFFADGDLENAPRSLFVVGDTKQSIYGFQGADPNAFAESREQIASNIKNNVREIQEIPLTQSFRSTEPILKTVDMFFGNPGVAARTGFINNKHKCFRLGEPGVVEVHALVSARQDGVAADVARRDYVRTITDKIEALIASGKYKANDIMILVRQRTSLVVPMTNELKRRGISVAGSDRIILPNYPIIRDFMNLLRFCMCADNDYALACVLKSPMFRLTDDEIYALCAVRNTENAQNTGQKVMLVDVVERMRPQIFANLQDLIQQYNVAGPYTFFSYVLNNFGAREKMVAALGTQILDPLEEFMTICLAYERTHSGTLRHFIKWFITSSAEIKRDMETGDRVRIVTVHGSKGLQSPVVFLIDTVSMPKSNSIYELQSGDKPVWLWTARTSGEFSAEFNAVKQAAESRAVAEHFRLLYVAMTRARDELYIYGFSTNTSAPELSWHEMLWQTLKVAPGVEVKDNIIRISNHDK